MSKYEQALIGGKDHDLVHSFNQVRGIAKVEDGFVLVDRVDIDNWKISDKPANGMVEEKALKFYTDKLPSKPAESTDEGQTAFKDAVDSERAP